MLYGVILVFYFLIKGVGASQSTGPLRSGSLGLWPIRGGPSQVEKVTTEGGVVNITKVEFRIRPRTPYSSAVCVRGRSRRGLVTIRPQNYVTTEDGITDQG